MATAGDDPRDELIEGVERYITQLPDDEFDDLVARTRSADTDGARRPDPAALAAKIHRQ